MFINLGVSANCPTQSGASTHTKLCGAIFSAVEASALAQTRLCGKYFWILSWAHSG